MVGIICTIGPSSFRKARALRKAGMDIARLNFAYAKNEQIRFVKGIPLLVDVRKVGHLKKIPQEYEYAAISFTDSAAQLAAARKLTKAKLVSKIESRKGMKNLRQIVKASDVVMVARGDLADAIGLENIGKAQTRIAKECRRQKKKFIVATGVLESMKKEKKPSRAEACDVSHAVEEGASYVMLSDETAVGKYPIEATRWLKKLVRKAG